MLTNKVLLFTVAMGLVPLAIQAADLEEVTVSARKKEESILKVPVVVSAITAESLDRYQVSDLYAVAAHAPGLQVGNNVGANGTQISLRGVGTAAVNATIDQSVSLNLDGLQLSHGLAYSAGMFDVRQVEVLKGPQALYYGKNSPGGVISLRSADPTNETEILLRTGYEYEAEEKVGEFVVSGPVADSLKLRLAAQYSDSEGFFRNDAVVLPNTGAITPTFRSLAPKKDWIVRGTALFNPSDSYDARIKLNYTQMNMDGNGGALQLANCPDGTGGVAPINIAFIGGDDCKLDRSLRMAWMDPVYFPGIRNGGIPMMDMEQVFGTVEQNFYLPREFTLTSVTGFYDMDMESLINGTGTGQSVPFGLESDYTNRQLTQELRLSSNFTGPVNFMLGGFYQDGELMHAPRLPGNTALGLPVTLQSSRHTIDIRSISFFGQLQWKVAENVEIAGGGRWTDEERNHEQINLNPAQGPVGPTVRPDPRLSASNFSPELSLTYTPTDDLTLFGSYKEGFKSGSFNTGSFVEATRAASFQDESVQGGEVGLKSRLLDRRMSLNLAGYYYVYDDLQVGANEITPTGNIVSRTLNAASANVYGIDLDAAWDPAQVEGLSLEGAVNWNHARYKDFPNGPCGNGQTISQGCNQLLNPLTGAFTSQDLSGKPLVRAPDWSASLGFNYEMFIFGDKTLSFGTSSIYSSKYYTNLVTRPAWLQSGFFKHSANVTLKGRNEGWEVALIGNNLNNKIISGNCYNSNAQEGSVFGGKVSGRDLPGPAGDDETNCVGEPGRAVWVRLTLRPQELFK